MFNATEILIDAFVNEIREGYRRTYGCFKNDYQDIIQKSQKNSDRGKDSTFRQRKMLAKAPRRKEEKCESNIRKII